MTLADLAARLRRFADGALTLAELRQSFVPALEADPLDVARSDAQPWLDAPDDSRLYWRLVHLFDAEVAGGDETVLRRTARRLVGSLDDAGSATTLELLRMLLDQERFATIVERHLRGVISRTGFLSVVAESGYPGHVKLWLQHADAAALRRLVERLAGGRVAEAAGMLERPP